MLQCPCVIARKQKKGGEKRDRKGISGVSFRDVGLRSNKLVNDTGPCRNVRTHHRFQPNHLHASIAFVYHTAETDTYPKFRLIDYYKGNVEPCG